MGVGIAGLTYLSYLGHQTRMKTPPEMQMHLFSPLVQQRIGHTFGYFSGACATTGAVMYMLRNSSLVHANPWLILLASMGTLVGTHMLDYERQWALKTAMYGAFVGTMSVNMLPLIHAYSMPVIYDALIATAATVGGLGAVAWNAPSE